MELTNEWDKETGGTSTYDENTGVWNFSDGTYGDDETVKGNSYLEPGFDITEAKGYSSYEKALDELNENKFNDDVKKDKAYKALEKERKEMGEAAYRDIIGREAAKTLGSVGSYGVAAASQAYMDYMDSITDEIPELYRMIQEEGYDLVSGYKQKRYDPLSKTIPTKLFNATARAVSGIKNLHDFNCGLKAYRKEVIKNIEVYGEMHRYIPYLAKNAGFKKIGEKVVQHQARKYGVTKFGLNRFVNGYLDLISLWFLSKFGIKPMHIFGLLGSLMFIIGFLAAAYIGISKLYAMSNGLPYILVTDSPYFYLALTTMILGTQLFLAGFLGEMIARNAPERNNYKIEKEL